MSDTKSRTSVEEILENLVRRISNWEIPAGQRLTEGGLSQEFGVSRTPVREALRMLEHAGYVERLVSRGYAVRAQELKAIDDIFTVRIVLEDLAVQMASHMVGTPAFRHLQDAVRTTLNQLGQDGDEHAMREAFHERLAELSQNDTLTRLLRDLDARIFAVRRLDARIPARARRAQEEHAQILELLAAGRTYDAQKTMREHIEQTQAIIRSLMASGIATVSFSPIDPSQ
jgi:DNA-binding GntR family transcriptional regulator